MEFFLHRDIASISFVRCVSPIPGTRIHAEGTGFSVETAIEKCRSEWIEANFQLAHPDRAQMLGIAAHPDSAASSENAWNETLETLLIQNLAHSPRLYGIAFNFGGTKFCLGRIGARFFALALFMHRGEPTGTQAVSRNPFRALLKAWSERRNLAIYDPRDLSGYTKVNRLLDASAIFAITIRPSWRDNSVATGGLKQFQHHTGTHTITYYLKEIR